MENFAPEVENLDNVPSDFHVFYQEGDGKFTLKDTAEVKQAVKAISGLNTAVKAARTDAKNAKGRQVDLSALSTYGDTPETIAEAVAAKISELEEAATSGDKKAKLDLEKIKKEFADQKAKELGMKDERITSLQSQLYDRLVVTDAQSAISSLEGNPKFLLPHIREQVKVQDEDGKQVVVVVDEANNIRLNSSTQLPMTVRDLVEEMKANEEFAPAFKSTAKSGTNTPPAPRHTKPAHAGKQEPINSVAKISQGISQGLHKAEGTLK